jgi:dipeptidyl aminopeptidase/acylaminoacyl peptidase
MHSFNRTPYSIRFSSGDRIYWEAPRLYYQTNPLGYADRIKTPILLIHDEVDVNTGTDPY